MRRRERPSARNRRASAPPAADKAPRQGCGRPAAAGGGSPFPVLPSRFTPPGSPPGPVAVGGSGRAEGGRDKGDSFPWRKHRAAASVPRPAADSAARARLREGAGGAGGAPGRVGGRSVKWRLKQRRSDGKRCLFIS